MSLFITVQVTKTPTYLEQIHGLTITNMGTGPVFEGLVPYRVTLDGTPSGTIYHDPGDGALVLLQKALNYLCSEGD